MSVSQASVEQGLMCCAANTPRRNDDHRPTEHNKLLFLLFNLDLHTSCPVLTILTSFREERGRRRRERKKERKGEIIIIKKKYIRITYLHIENSFTHEPPKYEIQSRSLYNPTGYTTFFFFSLFLLSEGVNLSQFSSSASHSGFGGSVQELIQTD
jgi:hypothetical protein